MLCTSVDTEYLFRLFTKCPDDPVTLVLDTRAYKLFKRRHVLLAYCVRLSANERALVVLLALLVYGKILTASVPLDNLPKDESLLLLQFRMNKCELDIGNILIWLDISQASLLSFWKGNPWYIRNFVFLFGLPRTTPKLNTSKGGHRESGGERMFCCMVNPAWRSPIQS